MRLDDAQHGGQPQSGALARRFGGEEGIENLVADRRRDAAAGVGDLEQNVGPRLGLGIHLAKDWVRAEVARLQGQQSAFGHGVAGVYAEIEQHLVDLGDIADHRPQIIGGLGTELDVLGESLARQPVHFLQQVLDAQFHALDFLAAAEGEQLPHDARAPIRAGAEQGQQFRVRGTSRVVGEQFRHHEDGGKYVVKIVRHATGKGSDALHALGAEELVFELLLLRKIGADNENGLGLALGIAHQAEAALDVDDAPIPRRLLQLTAPGTARQHIDPSLEQLPAHATEQAILAERAEGLGPRPAVELLRRGIPKLDPASERLHADGIRGNIQQSGLFAQLALVLAAIGVVFHHGKMPQRLAVCPFNEHHGHAAPDRRPARPQVALVVAEGLPGCRLRAAQQLAAGRQVFRMADIGQAPLA